MDKEICVFSQFKMSFRFTLSYQKSITSRRHHEDANKEVEDAVNIQDHYVGKFKAGTTKAEKKEFWEKKSAAERVLLEQNARLIRF